MPEDITRARNIVHIVHSIKLYLLLCTGVDKGGQGGPDPPNGRAKKEFFC